MNLWHALFFEFRSVFISQNISLLWNEASIIRRSETAKICHYHFPWYLITALHMLYSWQDLGIELNPNFYGVVFIRDKRCFNSGNLQELNVDSTKVEAMGCTFFRLVLRWIRCILLECLPLLSGLIFSRHFKLVLHGIRLPLNYLLSRKRQLCWNCFCLPLLSWTLRRLCSAKTSQSFPFFSIPVWKIQITYLLTRNSC